MGLLGLPANYSVGWVPGIGHKCLALKLPAGIVESQLLVGNLSQKYPTNCSVLDEEET